MLRFVKSRVRFSLMFAWSFLVAAASLTVAQQPQEASESKPRFIERGQFVEDTQTGLLWQKDGESSGKLNFQQAAEYAKRLKLGGLAGWRVPTGDELKAIFPADKAPFKNTGYNENVCCKGPGEYRSYWTCELDTRLDDYAYVYTWYAKGGKNNGFASKNFCYVRCVLGAAEAVKAGDDKPLDEAARKQASELIAQLGDESFEKREAAVQGLKKLGQNVIPQLTAALEQAQDVEVRYRLKKLLKDLGE